MTHFVDPQISRLTRRPTRLEISLAAVEHNLKEVRRLTRARIMPVVKANAYGHGIVEMARFFAAREEVFALAVGFLEEGLLLRETGLKLPILVLGGFPGSQVEEFLLNDLTITVSSLHKARQVSHAAEKLHTTAVVHLKIDTGMERIGVHYYHARDFVREVLRLPGLKVEGIYSHLATAEQPDATFAREQISRFLQLLKELEGEGIRIPLRHLANSAAVLRFPEAHLDLVRPGLMLYGYYPHPALERYARLENALSLKSAVVFFKVVEAGAGVSYGHLHHTRERTRVATVPVGYGDGYSRRLTGRARVLIRGQRLPVIGAICMDQLLVDLGPRGTAYNEDEVVLVGEQGGKTITVEDLAAQLETIPYEVITGFNTRMPRIYRS
jgi:alanine racemase